MRYETGKHGFTLIELLIVVAIIAILAAIAVPNFLEAQVRSKVSRCESDMRSIATALESYRLDHNMYPPVADIGGSWGGHSWPAIGPAEGLRTLSTPVAYMTSLPNDPFFAAEPADPWWMANGFYYYNKKIWLWVSYSEGWDPPGSLGAWLYKVGPDAASKEWMLKSLGPDKVMNWTLDIPQYVRYDSSNGTISWGEILRTGP